KLLEGHHADVVGVAFSPTGNLLVSTSWDGTTRLWDPASGRQLVVASGAFAGFPFDGKHVVLEGELWELADAHECRSLYGHLGPGKGPWSANFSPDGRLLASASSDGVRLWDVAFGKEIAWLPVGDSLSVVFHPTGDSIFTSGAAGAYRIPIRRPKEVARELHIGSPARLPLPEGWQPHTLALSADGRTLAISDYPHAQVLVSDLETQKILLRGTHGGTNNLAVTADGRWVASGSWGLANGTVRIWDVAAGKLARELPGTAASAAFSPDGRQLVVGD